MAPRKPTTTAKSAKKHTISERNKVTKRPARGYHKYKNGLLNVTPKGGEKELVERNSKSPLLSLPAEIRNRIWEYTLGYTDYLAHAFLTRERRKHIKKLSSDPGPGLALLRSCRQVYSEAALMPLQLSTLAFISTRGMDKAAIPFKKSQRQWIKKIGFVIYHPEYWKNTGFGTPDQTKITLAGLFPALESIEVMVLNADDPDSKIAFGEVEVLLRKGFALLSPDSSMELTVTKMVHEP